MNRKFKIGYNTNGFAHHDLKSAISVMNSLGYEGVAITVDYGILNPYVPDEDEIRRIKKLLEELKMTAVIETGARFLLNPMKKHSPNLLDPSSEGRGNRLDFYKKAVDVAEKTGAGILSYWSGKKDPVVTDRDAFGYLVQGSRELNTYAADHGVVLAFEPEPGMFIEDMAGWENLKNEIPDDNFKLTLDTGHMLITEKEPEADIIKKYSSDLVNVHLDDSDGKVHEHLIPGDGKVDFKAVFEALCDVEFSGLIGVELSRHSHMAPVVAQKAFEFIRQITGEK